MLPILEENAVDMRSQSASRRGPRIINSKFYFCLLRHFCAMTLENSPRTPPPQIILFYPQRIFKSLGTMCWFEAIPLLVSGQIKGKVTLVGYIRQAEGAVMGALAPKPGSSQTYIWRDSAVMGRVSGSLPITVELKGEHSVRDGGFREIITFLRL